MIVQSLLIHKIRRQELVTVDNLRQYQDVEGDIKANRFGNIQAITDQDVAAEGEALVSTHYLFVAAGSTIRQGDKIKDEADVIYTVMGAESRTGVYKKFLLATEEL